MELSGKNVIIVGGYGGIGFEICQALLQKNIANLVILDKSENLELFAKLQATNPKVAVHFWSYDITMDIDDMRSVFKRILAKIQTFDVLVNSAGICNEQKVALTIQINLIGLIQTTTVAIELLDKRHGGKGGLIVNISSLVGLNAFPSIPVYSATKAGVINFTESLSLLEPQTGIAAFSICPGITKTPILDGLRAFMDFDVNLAENVTKTSQTQTAAECGQNTVAAIELHKNGAIWVLDMGKMELVTKPPAHWEIPEELR